MRLREVKHHAQAQVRIQQVQDKEESQGGRWEGKQIVLAEGWLFCQTLSYYKHLMLTAKYHKVDIIISISQLRKLRFREVKKHTQSHTANQQESRFLQNLTVLSPPPHAPYQGFSFYNCSLEQKPTHWPGWTLLCSWPWILSNGLMWKRKKTLTTAEWSFLIYKSWCCWDDCALFPAPRLLRKVFYTGLILIFRVNPLYSPHASI